MSSVSSIGGGDGLQGYITDPPTPPEPGDRRLSDAPTPPEEGDRWLGAPPAASTPTGRYITDPPTAPAPGDRRLSDPRPPGPLGNHNVAGGPTGRPTPERDITDPPPVDLEPGDRWLTAPGGPIAEQPAPRKPDTAGDHALSSVYNVGKFFEDVWENNYGQAVLDAGLAVTDAGAAFYELLFGDEKRTPPPPPPRSPTPPDPPPPLTS
jgi:hypothetical protein